MRTCKYCNYQFNQDDNRVCCNECLELEEEARAEIRDQHIRNDKRYADPFEDDGAYADDDID